MYHKVQCDDKHWEYTILWKLPLWSNWLRRPTHNRYDTGSSPVGGTKYLRSIGRVVEGSGLLSRPPRKGSIGSNPICSAKIM